MKIRIKKGPKLPDHVSDMGVKPGQEYNAWPDYQTRLGAVNFEVLVDDHYERCTVLPEYFEVIGS